MKKQLILLFLSLIIAGTMYAQPNLARRVSRPSDLTAAVPVDKKVKVGHLDNGLTYYLRVNKKPEGRIQFRLVTNAGSVLEDETQLGLAHFCEHMAFNGTQHYPHNTMVSELQKAGVAFGSHINAYTSFDETVYFVNMPNSPEMVEMGMKILDGWASKLLFDQKEIEDERGVIHEEWRGTLGANDRLRKKVWPIMLKNSRYADRLPIGTEDIIMNFKRDEIVRFYHDWYRTDLQAVIIVGDFDLATMEAKVKEYFGNYQRAVNPKPRTYYDIPNNVEPLVAIATDKEASSTTLELMWKHSKAPQGTIGDYRQSIVRQLANGLISARLSELCEKPSSPFIAASGYYGGFLGRSCDAFNLYAYPKENRIEEATRVLLTEMRRIDQHGFLETELERQKEDLLDGFRKAAKEANKTQSTSLADEYTRNYLSGEPIPGVRQEFEYAKEFLPGITLEEVNQVVAGWITDENLIYYLTAPEKEGSRIPTEADVLKIIKEVKNVQTEAWVDNFNAAPLYAKTLPAVAPTVSKINSALGYTEYTLPNGIRFVVKSTTFKDDEIQMRSYAPGGISLYSDEEAYLVQTTAGIIDDAGIGDFSSTQLSKKLQGMTVGIVPEIDARTQGFRGSCSPKDLETMLQLLNLYYEAPRKDQESFEKNIEAMRTQYRAVAEVPQVALLKKLYETAYPNDKRTVVLPTEAQVNSLNLDRMYAVFKERFNDASNQTFFFVGNIGANEIATIARYLNNLPTTGKQRNEVAIDRSVRLADGITHGVAYKGTERMSMIIMAGSEEGFDATEKNRLAIDLLGECVQITTTEIIREKMGDTYSPAGTVDYSLDPKPTVTWQFFFQCDPDKTNRVEAAAIQVLKQYIKRGPNKETLSKAKEQMIKSWETRKQENGFWMNQIMASYRFGESRDNYISYYESIVNSITASDIKALAKKYINLKHYTVITLKPETDQ